MEEGLREAVSAYSRGDWEACLAFLDQIDASEVDHLDLAYMLGLVHVRLKNWDTALLYMEQVVTSSDEFLKVCQSRLILSLIYSTTGRTRLAEYELDRLVASGFESVQSCAGLGYACFAQGKTDEAILWYSKALEIDSKNPNALNGLGYVLASSGRDLARALACCRQAVALVPTNAAYLDSLGWACFKAGRMDEAREFIAEAMNRAPTVDDIQEHAKALTGAN